MNQQALARFLQRKYTYHCEELQAATVIEQQLVRIQELSQNRRYWKMRAYKLQQELNSLTKV